MRWVRVFEARGALMVGGALAIVVGAALLTVAVMWLLGNTAARGRPAAETPAATSESNRPPRAVSPAAGERPEHEARTRKTPEGARTGEAAETMLAEPIRWRRSTAVGRTDAGRLVRGVQLPSEGEFFFTWDPIRRTTPNRGWRRYGTDRLVRVLLRVIGEYRAAHPDAPRVAVGDLSRPRGGDFGPRFGKPGHASHQNGLDVDIYYPRRDRREREAATVGQVDRALAQDLVDRFVRAGARFAFVGTKVGLRGDPRIVQVIPNHNDHVHIRLWPRG